MTTADAAGRIGPNAITRMEEAVTAAYGNGFCLSLFARAGLARYLAHPPTGMVDEGEVAHLHAALHDCLPDEEAARVATVAGRLTGDYLLARRIPRAAQLILKLLPRPLAARLFTQAIAKHAWTFAGSGQFSAAHDAGGLVLCLHDNPACREVTTPQPSCHYFAATFERLYGEILGSGIRVVEISCEAAGDDCCSFRIGW